MVNRETRRRIDLDERRAERKKEHISVRYLDRDWEFPCVMPIKVIDAFEREKIGDVVRGLLGEQQGNELLAHDEFDTDELSFLLERVYGDEPGESGASSDS